MGYWYSPTYGYNEGDPAYKDSQSCPERPAGYDVLTAGVWSKSTVTLAEEAVARALASLQLTDIVMMRIQEAVALNKTTWATADVISYVTYRKNLREVVSSGGIAAYPTPAAYPVGT